MESLFSPANHLLIFTALHFAFGRTVSMVYAILYHLPLPYYIPLALGYDLVQIPLYGFILERSPEKFPFWWARRRVERMQVRMQEKGFLRLISSMGNVGIILISALPIKGFGILSGSIFSFLIGQKRFEGTLLLMVGSLLGIAIVFGLTTGVLQIISLF
jgi:uncharacterized membrane protein